MVVKNLNVISDPKARENIHSWLEGSFSEKEKNEVLALISRSPQEAVDAFYKKLEFGTAGIRGIMGVGINRINTFTIRSAIQAVINYMKKEKNSKSLSFMIGYDSRIHSREFAEDVARVLAGNGVKAFLLKHLRPTPYLSFNMRYKKCDAACMITASHNPKDYNGFKVYWQDGGQVLPPHDIGIIREFEKINDPKDILSVENLDHPLIEELEEECDTAYIKALNSLQCQKKINHEHGKKIKIVYTSLHGTGSTLLPKLFNEWGFSDISLVHEQCIPDGNFPTVKSPNPEDKKALEMGIRQLTRENGDLLLATDPDADRVGVALKHQDTIHFLSGNQIAVLLAEHILSKRADQHTLQDNAACLKSIVTTELFRKIATHYRVACFDLLPGFKYVAEKIRLWESKKPAFQFILAAEESSGYLYGTEARDKDALLSSLLIAEIALDARLHNKTLIDVLHGLYEKYGFFFETQYTINFPETKEGKESMERAMDKIRKSPPLTLQNKSASTIGDLKQGFFSDLKRGTKEASFLPQTDMIILYYEGGTSLMIRPSGTEPKIKIYLMLQKPINTSIEKMEELSQKEAQKTFEELCQFLECP